MLCAPAAEKVRACARRADLQYEYRSIPAIPEGVGTTANPTGEGFSGVRSRSCVAIAAVMPRTSGAPIQTPLLASRLDATTRYESVVPEGVKRADLEFKSSLEFRF